jgi:hypothetical protein
MPDPKNYVDKNFTFVKSHVRRKRIFSNKPSSDKWVYIFVLLIVASIILYFFWEFILVGIAVIGLLLLIVKRKRIKLWYMKIVNRKFDEKTKFNDDYELNKSKYDYYKSKNERKE